MPNAFVFTSSSKQAQQHFADTVQRGLSLPHVLEFVKDEEVRQSLISTYGDKFVYCWGGRSGGQDEVYWSQMADGDLIMGYRGGAIVSAGFFVGKLKSAEFGKTYWSDSSDRPFDLIYFFTKPQFCSRPIKQLPKYFATMYQGLRRLPTSPEILSDYGSFANFVHDALRDGMNIESVSATSHPQFIKGRVYNRRADIHEKFGGQKQGGIATPRSADCLFLFTGETGEQHGYQDGWTEDGVFVFYGEGQRGDMEFVRGNLAIRDHVAEKKSLHLFQTLGKQGRYRYVGEFTCGSTDFRDGPDTDGNPRRAIAFHLVPLEATKVDVPLPSPDANLSTLRIRAIEAASSAPAATVNETIRIVRERSAAVKQYVLRRANGLCESCGRPAPFERPNGQPYLEPHHTTRLADDGPDDPRFVGAVCPNCHCEIHYGQNGEPKNRELQGRLAEIENA